MKYTIKLVVSVNLKTGLKVLDVNIEERVTVFELLQTLSEILDYNLVEAMVADNHLVKGAKILLDDRKITDLYARIVKNRVVSVYPPD